MGGFNRERAEDLTLETQQKIKPYLEMSNDLGIELEITYEKSGIVRFGCNKLNVCRKQGAFEELKKWVMSHIHQHFNDKHELALHNSMLSFINSVDFGEFKEPNCWFAEESAVCHIRKFIYNHATFDDRERALSFAGGYYFVSDAEFMSLTKDVATWFEKNKVYEEQLEHSLKGLGIVAPKLVEHGRDGHLYVEVDYKKTIVIPKNYNSKPLLLNLRGKITNYWSYIRPAYLLIGPEAKSVDDFSSDFFLQEVDSNERKKIMNEICSFCGITTN